jgi:tetratricopeptide (TPR) repeat protein
VGKLKIGNAWNIAKEADGPSKTVVGAKFVLAVNNGSIEGAVSAYDEALKIAPDNTTILIHKALELSVLGRVNESSETYERALSLLDENLLKDPNDAKTWQWKATVLGSLNRQNESLAAYEKTLEAYDKRIELIPSSNARELASYWMTKAEVLAYAGGRWEEALAAINHSLEAYDKAIELIPENNIEDLALNWASKGLALNKTDRHEEARAAFQKSLESYDQVLKDTPDIEPSTTKTSAWINKGDSLRLQGKNEDALEAYNKAIDLEPHYSNAWHGWGEAQKAMGQVGNAGLSFLVADKLGYEE